ncbi:MAG: UTP--glucose-1-phosphate uridylyltransferase [Patescibacteria group bacterium]
MKIRKAVLPVAGMGTRFMPATKVVPKELLPIVDKPVIQYLVEEAVASGIEEIIFVISPDKELIRQHFSHHPELEAILEQRGKHDIAEKIRPIHGMAKFSYVYQNDPLGDGHAILQAEELVGGEPFAVLFGDDIVKHGVPAIRQLIDQFTGEVVMAVEKVPKEYISSYGVISPGEKKGRLYKVEGLVEKPEAHEAPSDFGVIGKFVCPASIFEAIRLGSASKGNEIRLIDGFIKLSEKEGIWAYHIEGERFDTGKAEGLIAANNAFL